jgi:hypothetical protein
MQNIDIKITEDDILVLKVNLRQAIGRTNSRRNMTIGTTGGNVPLWTGDAPHPSGAKINVNVFRPLTEEEQKSQGFGALAGFAHLLGE